MPSSNCASVDQWYVYTFLHLQLTFSGVAALAIACAHPDDMPDCCVWCFLQEVLFSTVGGLRGGLALILAQTVLAGHSSTQSEELKVTCSTHWVACQPKPSACGCLWYRLA